MCLERQSRRILQGKFGKRFDGADESYRNPAGLITDPPAWEFPRTVGTPRVSQQCGFGIPRLGSPPPPHQSPSIPPAGNQALC